MDKLKNPIFATKGKGGKIIHGIFLSLVVRRHGGEYLEDIQKGCSGIKYKREKSSTYKREDLLTEEKQASGKSMHKCREKASLIDQTGLLI